MQTPKGTRDFFPDEMRLQNRIFSVWRRICLAYGYAEYEGPMFEHLELYVGKSGPEIVQQLYNFKDKGDRDLALRPEMTPTLARMVNAKGSGLKMPAKWFSMPRLFRYERAQRGRLREFFQLNLDVIGTASLWAEVDLIAAIVAMLKGFGLQQTDFSVRISSRKVLSDFLDLLEVPAARKPELYGLFDRREKMPPEAFRDGLLATGLSEKTLSQIDGFFAAKGIDDLLSQSQGEGQPREQLRKSLDELKWLFDRLTELGLGDCIGLDLSIVRGLAYYTGIVFEVHDSARSLRAIAGGGRYDDLLQSLGGKRVTGVGFGMGDVVLAELLKERGLAQGESQDCPDYFVATFGDPDPAAWQLAERLRARGRKVVCSLDGGKLKKQLSEADGMGARNVILFGSDKAVAGKFEVKDLLQGGQCLVAEEDL